jgi:hypothetical protein
MGKFDEYQKHATECLEMARTVGDRDSRVILVEVAQLWMKLADRLKADQTENRRHRD